MNVDCVSRKWGSVFRACSWMAFCGAVLTGCAGTSAKSSDEIGRLGAELLLTGQIAPQGYQTDFKPSFR